MHQIRILESANRELKKIPKKEVQRIVKRIRWLGENIEHIHLEPLKGDLSGLYKLRTGDYRILYEVIHDEQVIVIHLIGNRKDIYRKRN